MIVMNIEIGWIFGLWIFGKWRWKGYKRVRGNKFFKRDIMFFL